MRGQPPPAPRRWPVVAALLTLAVVSRGWAEARAGEAILGDAVVAEVGGEAVTASDVGLARLLGWLGGQPGQPIRPADVDRYLERLLAAREARTLGVEVPPGVMASAWAHLQEPHGGAGGLAGWLARLGVDEGWARRVLTLDLLARRFVDLRFRALAFVGETEVDAVLGPGAHSAERREAVRRELEGLRVRERLESWLVEARDRSGARRLLADDAGLPDPLGALPEP